MGLTFEHTTLGQRVLSGTGKAAEYLAAEVHRLPAQRVVVVASARERSETEKITSCIDVALVHDDLTCCPAGRPELPRE
ncbi:MAG: hypothetical protein ABWX85_03975 [Arthrobacter sp.]